MKINTKIGAERINRLHNIVIENTVEVEEREENERVNSVIIEK